jgi:hypothetical protein
MADTLAQVQTERTRLMSGGRRLTARVVQSIAEAAAGTAHLEVKDARSTTGSEQELQAAFGTTPGGWRRLTVAQSQATFV